MKSNPKIILAIVVIIITITSIFYGMFGMAAIARNSELEKNLITLNQEYEDIKNQKTALEEEINNKNNTIAQLTEEVENLKK